MFTSQNLLQTVFLIMCAFLSFSVRERVNDRWEVCVTLSEGTFQQVNAGLVYEQVGLVWMLSDSPRSTCVMVYWGGI
jgi:Na+-transporting NADH:ubiquinone oxidoreductase subunit NqrE